MKNKIKTLYIKINTMLNSIEKEIINFLIQIKYIVTK